MKQWNKMFSVSKMSKIMIKMIA